MNQKVRREKSPQNRNEFFHRTKTIETMGIHVYSSKDNQSMHKSLNAEFILYQILLQEIFNQDKILNYQNVNLVKYFQPANPLDKIIMEEFDQEYQSSKAIYWYTRESPIYKLLNKALRTQNIDDLKVLSQFLHDLNQKLKEEKIIFTKNQKSSILILYRGQFISKDEIKRLKSTQGELISMNSFLSTSTNKKKALQFLKSHSPPNDELTLILLKIFVNIKSPTRPLADVQHLSAFPDEEEILFTFGSIFRIDEIYFDDEQQFWKGKLTLCCDADNDMQQFLSSFNEELKGQNQFISIGNYFIQMQKYEEAEEHYLNLLDDNLISNPLDFAYCHYGLAQVSDKKNRYPSAIQNLQIALNYLFKYSSSNNHVLLSLIYNHLGSIYTKQTHYSIATQFYEKALNTQNNISSTSYQGLADIQFQMKNYLLALEYLEKALTTEDQQAYQSIAKIYIQMGKIFAAMNNKDKASEMFDKAIESQLKFLPANHPDLSYTYSALGLMYSDLNDQDKAFEFIQKSYQLQLEYLPNNHLDFAQTYKDFAYLYMKKEDLDQSLIYYNLALENQLKTFLWNHPSVAETYFDIGSVYRKKKDYDKTLVYYHKIVDSELSRSKPGDQTLTIAFENLANVYYDKEDEDQALIYYHKQLDNELKVKLVEDISLADLYKIIGDIYYKKLFFSECLIHYNRLVDCYLNGGISNEKDIIECYNLIGKVYLKRKDFRSRLLYYQNLEIKLLNKERFHEESFDESFFKKSSCLSVNDKIVNIYFEKRHFDQSMNYFSKCLEKELNIYSERNETIDDFYQILGNICYEKEDLNQSLNYFLQLLKSRLRSKKKNSSSLSYIYKIIGKIYFENNQLNESFIYFNRFIDCQFSKKTPFEERSIIEVYQLIGEVILAKNYFNQQSNFLNNSIKIFEESNLKNFRLKKYYLERTSLYFQNLFDKQMKNFPLKFYSLEDFYIILGNLAFEKGDFFQSVFYYQQLLTYQLMKNRPENIFLCNIYALIGLVYFKQGFLDLALYYYRQGLQIAERINPENQLFIDKLKSEIRQIILPIV